MDGYELPAVPFATRATGELVTMRPNMTLVCGNSGAAKSSLYRGFLAGLARQPEWQAIIISPKLMDYAAAAPRFAVLEEPETWAQAVIALQDEVTRRAYLARERGLMQLDVTPDEPGLLLVVEEAPAVVSSVSSLLTKKEAEDIRGRLVRLSRMGRAQNCYLALLTQSAYAEAIGSGIKPNLLQRICLRQGSETEAESCMERGDPQQNAEATMLQPGECLALTDSTHQRYVRCRGFRPETVRFDEVMAETAELKRPLRFLEERGIVR